MEVQLHRGINVKSLFGLSKRSVSFRKTKRIQKLKNTKTGASAWQSRAYKNKSVLKMKKIRYLLIE